MNDYYCPSCGGWVDSLDENTGWCVGCTPTSHPGSRSCFTCNKRIPSHYNHRLCSRCKAEEWLAQHADSIELYMMVGWSFATAKQQVINDIRPNCVICDTPISGGNADSIFCTIHKTCRTAQRRYRLYREKGMTKDEAVEQAIKAGRGINEHDRAAA